MGIEKYCSEYVAENGQKYPCYNLPRRECHLMVMSESYKVQAAVYDRMESLDTPKTYAAALRKLADSVEALELAEANLEIAQAHVEILKIELDESKDFATIKRMAFHNGIDWQTIPWKELKAANIRITGKQNKIFDANYPKGVNSYCRQAWQEVFPDLDFPG